MGKSFKVRCLFICLCALAIAGSIAAGVVWLGDRNPKQAFERGLAAYRAADTPALAAAAVELTKHKGFESHQHLLKGLMLMQNQMSQEALREFSEALGDADTTALALVYSGEVLYIAGAHRDAERMLLAAVEADPTLVDAHRYLIAIYYDIGAMDNALAHIAKVKLLAPDDMRPWRIEGLILKDFEKYDEATIAYQGALERSPEQAIEQEIRLELAECLFQVRRHEEALTQLKQVSPSAESLGLTTECLLALGRTEEAALSLTHALKLDSRNLRALTVEVTLMLEQGATDAALEKLEQAIAMHPHDFNLRSIAMQTHQKRGETQKADEQLAKMKELRDMKDRFAALHIKAIRNPTDAAVRFELGHTAERLGMDEAAIGWFRATLSMDPSNVAAREQLMTILARLSQRQGSGNR